MKMFTVIIYSFLQLASIAHGEKSPLGGIVDGLLGGGVDAGCPAIDPIDHSVYLPAEHCDQFYECSLGHAILYTCPQGLQFSIELQLCDWPNNVVCGTRRT